MLASVPEPDTDADPAGASHTFVRNVDAPTHAASIRHQDAPFIASVHSGVWLSCPPIRCGASFLHPPNCDVPTVPMAPICSDCFDCSDCPGVRESGIRPADALPAVEPSPPKLDVLSRGGASIHLGSAAARVVRHVPAVEIAACALPSELEAGRSRAIVGNPSKACRGERYRAGAASQMSRGRAQIDSLRWITGATHTIQSSAEEAKCSDISACT